MSKENKKVISYNQELESKEGHFLSLLESVGLPINDIFVPIKERTIFFSNASSLLAQMSPEQKFQAVYISKFFAAVSVGLFDAALNYIWDETILQLRKRIEVYDLEYFYEIAASPEKRKDLKTIDDISKLTDDELLKGALKIDLITEVGYRNIDLIKYMRNNASAAHPNQLKITGLKLTSMAEDCLREIISTPIPPAAIAVQKLLENIKNTEMSKEDAKDVAVHFAAMGPEPIQRLTEGLFGIFYKRETTEPVRQNIRLLAPLLWPYVDENIRKSLGIKHAYFSANNNIAEKGFAKEFLAVVDGLKYITDPHRTVEVSTILEELKNAHGEFNNFYNEVLPAKRLRSVLGNPPKIPNGIEQKYIATLVEVFLTNGNGVANSANDIYLDLIKGFNPRQSIYAIGLIFSDIISSKLRIKLCQQKYFEMIGYLKEKISIQSAKRLIEEIESLKIPLDEIRSNENLKELAEIAIKETP
ncbi:MAG: hypothetical protein RLZZ517_77 [Candidatus Parcubacteria bacterium]|jgi:hypothetical protein